MLALITITDGARSITATSVRIARLKARLSAGWITVPADTHTREIWRNRQAVQCNDIYWETA